MSNIKLYHQQNLSEIPHRDMIIQQALQSRMLKDITHADLFNHFKKMITKSYITSRYATPEPYEMEMIIDETMKMAKDRYGSLREDEVEIAFSRGVTREYGDFKGLSFPTFIDFIKGYMKEESRIKLTKPVEAASGPPSMEEQFAVAKQNALKAFEDFKKQNDIHLVAPVTFRFLRYLKLIVLAKEESESILKEAKQRVLTDLRMKQSGTTDKNLYKEIENQIGSEATMEEKSKFEAQRLALYTYFQQLMLEETDLEQLIEANKYNFTNR